MKDLKLEILSGFSTNLPIVTYRSEAKDMLGDDWVQIHRRIVQQHANQYKRISWAKVNFFIFNFPCPFSWVNMYQLQYCIYYAIYGCS